MAKKRNKGKKKNKVVKTIIIIVAIILVAFMGLMFYANIPNLSPVDDTAFTGTTSGGSSGGGTDTGTEGSGDWSWFNFPSISLPSIEWPCFWNCDEGTTPTDEATTPQCVKNADCINICANPDTATCVDGTCSCSVPSTTTLTCFDSDKSLADRDTSVYEIKGICYEDGIVDSRGLTDYCARGDLVEYYCRTDTACATITVDCAEQLNNPDAFCYDGACTWLV